MKLSRIKPNPNNPRLIKDEKFKKLVQSIKDFPAMMRLRPIVVNPEMMILGGNMRFKACQHLGMKEIPDDWLKIADGLTQEEEKRFIIEDNVPFGEWDWDILANIWDYEELQAFGLDIKDLKGTDEIVEELYNDDELIDITVSVRNVYFDKVHKAVRKSFKDITTEEVDEKCLLFLVYSKKIYDIMHLRDKVGQRISKRYALYIPVNFQDLQNIISASNGDVLTYLQQRINAR